ncbi:MAG: urea carboxylase-associated family protein [Dehalococcoidia bacterium]|nr:urea carboxylase-associated family protein [Dehalococcoidia bacterium]
MTSSPLVTIPARGGKAAFVEAGQRIRVINTHGQQVVDTWAFRRDELTEFMSMEHSRTFLSRIMARVGDSMVTNHRRPILTLVEDTTVEGDSAGIHDTLLAACDRYRYELLGCEGYHDNCTDNLAAALAELGLTPPETPSPWNLFMNIPVASDGTVSFQAPVSRPGDSVTLRAEMDCVVAFSACPQDIVPINGVDCIPTEAHLQIFAA